MAVGRDLAPLAVRPRGLPGVKAAPEAVVQVAVAGRQPEVVMGAVYLHGLSIENPPGTAVPAATADVAGLLE